jgi:hypothetical protein
LAGSEAFLKDPMLSIILLLMPESGNENLIQVLIKNIQKNVGESPANALSQWWPEKRK